MDQCLCASLFPHPQLVQRTCMGSAESFGGEAIMDMDRTECEVTVGPSEYPYVTVVHRTTCHK